VAAARTRTTSSERKGPKAKPRRTEEAARANLTEPDARSHELRALLRREGVGRDVDASADAILAICYALGRGPISPVAVGALHLVVEATDALRQLATLGQFAPLGHLGESGTARAVGFARLALNGFVVLSENLMTVGPNMFQVVVLNTVHQYVKWAESHQGAAYASLAAEDQLALAGVIAQAIFQYLGRAPKAADLLPAMAKVGDTWDWQLDRLAGHGKRVGRSIPSPSRKAQVFFDLLALLDLRPHNMAALYQAVKIHANHLLDSE
jgi:hypothetical protein